ncbi:MAG: GNAT family N-acetyltransferase [Myxococcales bacterium]|nr:GNAT family N-acetyltransferase [Myxococcales bacterium]
MKVIELTSSDDLAAWAHAIEAARWEDDGEGTHTEASLRAYLADPTNVMVVCHRGGEVLGIASASVRRKPYAVAPWLYVDEVDTALNHRRRGVAKAMMTTLLAIAARHHCIEVWLGTELDNVAARGLYSGVPGAEEETFVGYTFTI